MSNLGTPNGISMSNKTSYGDNMYTKRRLQDAEKHATSKPQSEYSFILSCKRTKKINSNFTSEAYINTKSKGSIDYLNNQDIKLENEIVKIGNSSELNIKKEVDYFDSSIEDSSCDEKYSVEKDFYDLGVTVEHSYESDNDENYKNVNLSNINLIDNMFKPIGSLSDSLVECKVCYKQIKETSKRQHCNTHTGLKPFPCCYCGARFTRRGDALRHRKTIHRNIRPFQCVICLKNFAERKLLISHLRNHDRAVYYSCATCGYKFGKKEYFQSHIQYIHPSTKEQSIAEMKDIVKKGKKQLESLLLEETSEDNHLNLMENDDEDDSDIDIDSNQQINLQGKESKIENMKLLPNNFQVTSTLAPLTRSNSGESHQNKITKEEEIYDPDIKTETLSFTQNIQSENPSEDEDEDLVNKAINSAISQSKCVLEKLSSDGSNLTSDQKNKRSSKKKEITLITVSGKNKDPEIHITANFGGSLKKFIIHMPNNKIDPLSKEGLDSLFNLVNYVCTGKEDIIGPVEIELHQQS